MSELAARKRSDADSGTHVKARWAGRIGFGILYLILGILAVIQIYPLLWLFLIRF